MIKHTDEFKREAVRITVTSGLPRDRVASDLGGRQVDAAQVDFAIPTQ